jgi:D-alanyl-D-alanine carboxypeptidase
MPSFAEEPGRCMVGCDAFGREVALATDAAQAWVTMRDESVTDGIQLQLLSGFRSIDRQADIVGKKLAAGQSLEAILRVNAYPGFSEHHTGRAIDLGSPDCEHFSEAFEATREFRWLGKHASRFGFSLSYPRDNPCGIAYEPWHWCMSIKQPKKS